MIELLGILFGGVGRLAQHWLDLRDKDKERQHELNMFDKQVSLQDKKYAADAEARRMDAASAEASAEWAALTEGVRAQAEEAKTAGGWVASFSAAIRPFLTVYHAVLVYTVVKSAQFYLMVAGGMPVANSVLALYTEFDKALVGTMVSWWFADRSLRKLK